VLSSDLRSKRNDRVTPAHTSGVPLELARFQCSFYTVHRSERGDELLEKSVASPSAAR
jgi:hypothetical protein